MSSVERQTCPPEPWRRRVVLALSALLLLGIGVAILLWHLKSVSTQEDLSARTLEVEKYNSLLTDAAVNPTIGSWENFEPAELQLLYEEHRADSLEKWTDVAKESQSPDVASNAIFTVGLIHYLNAGDFGDSKEAGIAVDAFSQALLLDNGNSTAGYTADDLNKRKMLELALILRQKIQKEEEKQQQQNELQQVPVPKDGENGDSSAGSGTDGEPGLEDLPVLGTGVRP